MTTGERIRDARKKAGMTQGDIAEKMGVSKQAICHWENGERNAKLETIKKIANVLDVPFESLITDDEERRKRMDPMDLLKGVVDMSSNTEKREAYLQKMEEESERREKAEIACAHILEDMEMIAHHIAAKIDTDNGNEDIEGLAIAAAKVATAAAHLRMSVGYTVGMGCYAGMPGETEEA